MSWKVTCSPFHAAPRDYWLAGALTAGVLASSTLDRTVRSDLPHWRDGWTATADDIGWGYSRSRVLFGSAGALYLTGLVASSDDLRRTGQEIVEAFCIAHAGTQTIKHLVGRSRPYNNEGPFRFYGWSLDNHHLSFPSGDVTNAFVLSTVLAREIGHPAASVALYGLAGTTLFQRLHHDRHWTSDTFAAAIWATAVSRAVVHQHKKLRDGKAQLSILPTPSGVTLALRLD